MLQANTPTETPKSTGCAVCAKPCVGTFVLVGTRRFHSECLRCSHCFEPLHQGFCEKDSRLYCADHYKALFAPKCTECHDVLEGPVMEVQGRQYHPKCFACGHCGNAIPVGDSFAMTEDLLTCSACVEAVCLTCNRMTRSHNRVVIAEHCYHRRCLSCTTCNTALKDTEATVFNRQLYCHEHAKVERRSGIDRSEGCAACGDVIQRRAVLAMGKQWHKECFTCATCHVQLSGTFVPHDGKPYCERDFAKLLGLHCSTCTLGIKGEYLVLGDRKFHKECARCGICSSVCRSGARVVLPRGRQAHVSCLHCSTCGKGFESTDTCFVGPGWETFCLECGHKAGHPSRKSEMLGSKLARIDQTDAAPVTKAVEKGSSSSSTKDSTRVPSLQQQAQRLAALRQRMARVASGPD
eukprot:m.81564 g.81564  ORF g.81564 m.81564 type:complete len:408 (-) comp14696_c0_seq3:126-1349(-)